MNRLIGLAGRKRVGKDTLGALLAENYGYTRIAFADKVKEAVIVLDPLLWTVEFGVHHLSDEARFRPGMTAVELCDELKDEQPEVRRLLQRMGTEVGQQVFGKSVWVDLALGPPVVVGYDSVPTVITDVRFPHEVAAIHQRGGVVIRIARDVPRDESHSSETLVDTLLVDETVHNNGTIEGFLDKAVAVLSRLSQP